MKPTFNYDEIFPDRWLHAEDLKGKAVTLTITAAYQEDLRLPGGSVETCGILSFAKTTKEYVLNKSNAMVLRELWGPQSGEWAGHKIVLEAIPDTSGKSASGYRIAFTGSPDLDAPATVRQPQNKTKVIAATGKKAAVALPEPPQDPTPDAVAGPDSAAEAATAIVSAASGKTLAALMAAAERVGLYPVEVAALADKRFGIEDIEALNEDQARALIAEMEGAGGSV